RRSAGDRGRNRHVRHHVLIAAAGQPGQKAADRLDAVLRIARQANDDVVERLGTVGARRGAARGVREVGAYHRGVEINVLWAAKPVNAAGRRPGGSSEKLRRRSATNRVIYEGI